MINPVCRDNVIVSYIGIQCGMTNRNFAGNQRRNIENSGKPANRKSRCFVNQAIKRQVNQEIIAVMAQNRLPEQVSGYNMARK